VTRAAAALLALVLAAGPGCARTVYTNLHPRAAVPEAPAPDRTEPQGWRHFFVFGWAPGERVIDAAEYCEGTARIERIETRQSFLQGLIASFAGYYVNIYSPYTGRVVCDRHTAAGR